MESKSSVNKTKLVRRILDEIGAIGDNPPYDWKKMVDERLIQAGIDPTKVNSYAIRQKATKDSSLSVKTPDCNKTNMPPNFNLNADFEILLEIKNLIAKVGGKKNFLWWLQLFEKLSS